MFSVRTNLIMDKMADAYGHLMLPKLANIIPELQCSAHISKRSWTGADRRTGRRKAKTNVFERSVMPKLADVLPKLQCSVTARKMSFCSHRDSQHRNRVSCGLKAKDVGSHHGDRPKAETSKQVFEKALITSILKSTWL